MSIPIETHNLSKEFPGGVRAVVDLSLKIKAGTVYGLIGKNGAGKTTLLRLLAGLLSPTRGESRLWGEKSWDMPFETKQRFVYVSQNANSHRGMTLQNLCQYVSHFYPNWDQAYAEMMARRFEIPMDRKIALLSGGQQRKAALVPAFAARTELLLLDEPASGLDPLARREVIDRIIALLNDSEHATVVLSSHILSDLERVSEQIGYMENGRLQFSRPLDELQTDMVRVQIIFPGDRAPDDFELRKALRLETSGPVVTGVVSQADASKQLDRIRSMEGVRVQTFPVPLEDVLIAMFGVEEESIPVKTA
jgi:ABC-2 type transport system ATP-binding protein